MSDVTAAVRFGFGVYLQAYLFTGANVAEHIYASETVTWADRPGFLAGGNPPARGDRGRTDLCW